MICYLRHGSYAPIVETKKPGATKQVAPGSDDASLVRFPMEYGNLLHRFRDHVRFTMFRDGGLFLFRLPISLEE